MTYFYKKDGEIFVPERINPDLSKLAQAIVKTCKLSFKLQMKTTSLNNAVKTGKKEQMLEEGKAAVAQALGGLNQYKLFASLLDEFNARETPEAKFAHLCDKLECNFRAKLYSDFGFCPIENGQKEAIADPEVQENLKKGAKSVSDLFLMHIMHEYVGTPFEEIANCLKNYDTTQI